MVINYHAHWKRIAPLIGGMLLLGCGDNPVKPDSLTATQIAEGAGYILLEPVQRIRNYRIDGWNYVNNRAITLDTGVNDTYLVTLLRPCRDLRTSDMIATTSTIGDLTKYDSIIADFNSTVRLHCPIDKLYRLEKKPSED